MASFDHSGGVNWFTDTGLASSAMLILRPTVSDSQEVNAKKANEEKINTEREFLISRIFYRLYIEMNKVLSRLCLFWFAYEACRLRKPPYTVG